MFASSNIYWFAVFRLNLKGGSAVENCLKLKKRKKKISLIPKEFLRLQAIEADKNNLWDENSWTDSVILFGVMVVLFWNTFLRR